MLGVMNNFGARTLLRMIAVSVVLMTPLGAVALRRQLSIDTCLDRGGCFDYTAGECVFDHAAEQRCAGPHSWLPGQAVWLGAVTAVAVPLALAGLWAHDRRTHRASGSNEGQHARHHA